MNLSPKVWGPYAWFFLDSIVLSLDEKNIDKYKAFFEQLQYVLPCGACRSHFGEYLRENPLMYVDTRDKFIVWINNLHNMVRKRNGSKPRSIKQVIAFYNSQYNNSNFIPYCTISLSLLIFVLLFFKRRVNQ